MEKPGDWLRTYFKLGDRIDLYALEQLRAEADRLDGVGMTEIEEVLQAAREKWPEADEITIHGGVSHWYAQSYSGGPELSTESECRVAAYRNNGWTFVGDMIAPTLSALLEKIRGAK